MAVSYNKLLKLLIDRGQKKTEFAKAAGLSSNTLAKLSKNEYISMEMLLKICKYLECTVDEIMDILPDKDEQGE